MNRLVDNWILSFMIIMVRNFANFAFELIEQVFASIEDDFESLHLVDVHSLEKVRFQTRF